MVAMPITISRHPHVSITHFHVQVTSNTAYRDIRPVSDLPLAWSTRTVIDRQCHRRVAVAPSQQRTGTGTTTEREPVLVVGVASTAGVKALVLTTE